MLDEHIPKVAVLYNPLFNALQKKKQHFSDVRSGCSHYGSEVKIK